MSLISAIRKFFAPQQIDSPDSLRRFMESRAAYLVQKSITEYTQARAGVLYSTLMREPIYIEGYARARWHSYPAAISMMAEMISGALRQADVEPGAQFDAALQQAIAVILAQYPEPSGLGEAFWQAALAQAARDLAKAALAAPKPVLKIPNARVREIFDVLPVNDQLKQHDYSMFSNTVRFHLTSLRAEFDEKANMPALLRCLRDQTGG